jgi:hypothetical protein
MCAYQDGLIRFDGYHCFLLEGIQLERVLFGFGVATEGCAFVALREIDFVNASLFLSHSLNVDIFESLGCIFVITLGILFWKFELLSV